MDEAGRCLQDEEGVQIMEVLGSNMAMLLKQMDATKELKEANNLSGRNGWVLFVNGCSISFGFADDE